MSEATAWRYVDKTFEVLAAWAPGLHEALVGLGEGTLIPTDRIKADEPYYSMKHKRHGMNIQVIVRPDDTPLFRPGPDHDGHLYRDGLPPGRADPARSGGPGGAQPGQTLTITAGAAGTITAAAWEEPGTGGESGETAHRTGTELVLPASDSARNGSECSA